MTDIVRGRGRPRKYARGEDGKKILLELDPATGLPKVPTKAKAPKVRTDAEVLAVVKDRFNEMLASTKDMTGDMPPRALIISGEPGVGKTYNIEQILEKAKVEKKVTFEIVRGVMTGINLYKVLYRNRAPNAIVVLDDVDSIWTDENAMNLLKAATDTLEHRRLSWFSESFSGGELGDESDPSDIPQQFDFEGMVIFITNLDFDAYLSAGDNKFKRHMKALQNRALYVDLLIHGKRELALWIGHVLRGSKVLADKYGLSERDVNDILDYLSRNQNAVRSLSIRSAIQCAGLMKRRGKEWKRSADVLLLKESR